MFDGTTYMKFEQKSQIQSNGEDLSLRFKTQYARGKSSKTKNIENFVKNLQNLSNVNKFTVLKLNRFYL